MASFPRGAVLACFFFVVVALYGRSQASTAGDVYDVTEYGAATANSDNKDVSSSA